MTEMFQPLGNKLPTQCRIREDSGNGMADFPGIKRRNIPRMFTASLMEAAASCGNDRGSSRECFQNGYAKPLIQRRVDKQACGLIQHSQLCCGCTMDKCHT